MGEERWHTLEAQAAGSLLATDLRAGLTSAEAARRLEEHGPNRIHKASGVSALAIFARQFRSVVVGLLLAATAIAFALGEEIEALAIFLVVILNAALGFLTEWQADRALKALAREFVPVALVVRGGRQMEIAAGGVVRGDLMVLAAGCRVPADGRLVEAASLELDEAVLTGESRPVSKGTEALGGATPLAERRNMAFAGTTVTLGRGLAVVTATAIETEVGKIGRLMEATRKQPTPLERKLQELGEVLVAAVLVLSVVIVAAGWLRGHSFLHMLETGISLAVAAIPEGLPAVATMTLAIGMQRMATMRALVRRLPAVETLGTTTIISTDKTGTLTRNEMSVGALVLSRMEVETAPEHARDGVFRLGENEVTPRAEPDLELALRIGALCNDAVRERGSEGGSLLGDPTETALVAVAERGLGGAAAVSSLKEELPRLDELPFDSGRKLMVTVHRTRGGGTVAFVKGSPEAVLARCARLEENGARRDLLPPDRERILDANERLARRAFRVLALAYRELPADYGREDLEKELVFVALAGLHDPPRAEVPEALRRSHEAGIRTIMITGDQATTALEVARRIGLDPELEAGTRTAVSGGDLDLLEDDDDWRRTAARAAVYSRVTPAHKLRIVETLQSQGHIVAMTGDGVNDAPALKRADIGVAMGIKGTEVSKEAADMVITDDNFATIITAVEQGRIIYANILKFIRYLLSCNLSEILTVFAAILIGWPLPLAPLQILWLNMITDVLPALALALERSAPGMMQMPPRSPRAPLLSPRLLGLIGWQGAVLAGGTLAAFGLGLMRHGESGLGLSRAMTMAFMALSLSQLIHAFSSRSGRDSAFSWRLFTNRWLWGAVGACALIQAATVLCAPLASLLRTTPLDPADWAMVAATSSLPLFLVEALKWAARRPRPGARAP
jgi:Ca2+-transporting ATPase